MNPLLAKLKKNSRIAESDVLADSKFFNDRGQTPTKVPMLNTALGGSITAGIGSGILSIAGPSRHFKTSFALEIASAYMEAKPESILLFYDSEFGSPQTYFKNFGIDTDRVLHTPVKNVESLKFDIVNQLENITEKDDVIIVIDSIGNLASKKEVEDAKDQKSVADMSRAKAIKGLFRIITPYLKMNDIPLIAINHTYKEMSMYPRDIPSGGTGILYSSDGIWIIGRTQKKDSSRQVTGYDFTIKIEKSRFVREGRHIPISVSWDSGIEKNSGLLDVAMAGKYVIKPKAGKYVGVNPETGEILHDKEYSEKGTLKDEFWDVVFKETNFEEFIKGYYMIGHEPLADEKELSEALEGDLISDDE